MEEEMTANDIFPLLKLPAGVEMVLLPFVATGTGGLQALLNLREVCSTTKSWVDCLPPRQRKSLYSTAQVRMDSDVETIERFLESPPSSSVSALSLNIKNILEKYPWEKERGIWVRFCAVWASRLENLQLRNEREEEENDDDDIFNDNPRILDLIESPRIPVSSHLINQCFWI